VSGFSLLGKGKASFPLSSRIDDQRSMLWIRAPILGRDGYGFGRPRSGAMVIRKSLIQAHLNGRVKGFGIPWKSENVRRSERKRFLRCRNRFLAL